MKASHKPSEIGALTIQGYSYTVSNMKTTIDMPEDLVLEAKTAALSRKTTLRSLVLRGLRREIQNPSLEPESPIRGLLDLDTDLWRNTSADRYVKSLRKDWT